MKAEIAYFVNADRQRRPGPFWRMVGRYSDYGTANAVFVSQINWSAQDPRVDVVTLSVVEGDARGVLRIERR